MVQNYDKRFNQTNFFEEINCWGFIFLPNAYNTASSFIRKLPPQMLCEIFTCICGGWCFGERVSSEDVEITLLHNHLLAIDDIHTCRKT